MASQDEAGIGERLRACRQDAKKTQAVVAGLAGVTEDYLSQIERGRKEPALPLLYRFAKILDVNVSVLLGEPESRQEPVSHPAGAAVQRALTTYADADGPADLAALRSRVDAAWTIWQGSPRRYTEITGLLPDLVTGVQAAQRGAARASTPGTGRREAQRIAADLYFLLRTFTRRIGRTDLSLLAADRGVLAAEAADDPVRIAAAHWNLGHALLAQGSADGAEDVAMRAIGNLRRDLPAGHPGAQGMTGALWLVTAVAAVRNNDPWTARDRLREHAMPAARATGETNVMRTVFGPANTALHAVSVEMEMGETAEALRLADGIDVSAAPSLERRTTFNLELARCYEQKREDPGVFLHLLNAEASGPEDMRYNPLARDLVRGLLRRARPTYAPQVKALAERTGLLP